MKKTILPHLLEIGLLRQHQLLDQRLARNRLAQMNVDLIYNVRVAIDDFKLADSGRWSVISDYCAVRIQGPTQHSVDLIARAGSGRDSLK